MISLFRRRWAKRLVDVLSRPRAGLPRKQRRERRRLILEQLEDRTVLSTVNWIGASGIPGNWNDANKWLDATTMTNHVPGATDDAVINVSGVTVTHGTGSDTVHSLTVSNGTFSLSGGTLNAGTLEGGGLINLSGGTLASTTVASGTTVTGTGSGGALSGATFAGNLDLSRQQNASVRVYGGLVLNGTMTLGDAPGNTYGRLYVADPNNPAGALTGTGTVVFGGWGLGGNFIENDSNLAGAPGALTIGAGVTVRGKNGSVYSAYGNGSLVNQGTISADTAGGIINLGGNGADPFTNQGTINVSGATLGLYGSLTLAGLGTINRSGGTINLGGTLDLQGGTWALNAGTGSWNLIGGVVRNGTLNESGGALLLFTSAGGALSSVTVNGDMDLSRQPGAYVRVYGGLVLNGTMTLGDAPGNTYGRLYVADPNNPAGGLTGNATVVFGGWGLGGNFIENDSNLLGAPGALTLGAGVTVRGKNGAAYSAYGNGSLVNQGTVSADTLGGTINLGGSGASAFTNQGTINVGPGSLGLYGSLTLAGLGTINRSGGTISLGGNLDLQGGTWALNAGTGSWSLVGGVVRNGTLGESGGAELIFTNAGGALSGMTVNGPLDLSRQQSANVRVYGGLTLNGTATLGDAGGNTYGRLYFADPNNPAGGLAGNATVVFGGWGIGGNFIENDSNLAGAPGALTLGGVVTLRGTNGSVYSAYGNGSLVNQGTIDADGGSILVNLGTSGSNSGTIEANGGSLSVTGTNWTNSGTIEAIGTGLSVGGTWTNSGTALAQNGGTLSATTPTNYSSGTLTGGTWEAIASGTLRVAMSAGIVTNAATIVLDGPNSNFYSDSGTTDALASTFALNAAAGSFAVADGYNFTTAGNTTTGGNFENDGTLTVGANSTFTVAGSLANFDGVSTLTGGTYLITGTFQFSGANIQTNAASITLNGPVAQITDLNGIDALGPNLALNTAGASLTVQNGYSFTTGNTTIGGNFENDGTLTVGSGSTFMVSGNYTDTNTLNVLAGGTLNLAGGGTASGSVSVAGTLIVGAGATFTDSGSYTETGTLLVQTGATATLSGTFGNYDGVGTLTGGTYDLLGTLQFANAVVSTIACNLILDGPAAAVTDLNGNDALGPNLTAIAATGHLTLLHGATFSTSTTSTNNGDLTNLGILTIGAGCTFTVNGNYTMSGTLTIGAGSTVMVSGNYTQMPSGTLDVQLGGAPSSGLFGQLMVTGRANLTGTLQIDLVNDYSPIHGHSFTILSYGTRNGDFPILNIPDGGVWDPNAGTVTF
jgi:hypothetical protein